MSSTSFPLGIVNGAPFLPGPAVRLDLGDWVLMFTDGIIDARDKDGEPLGKDRFFELAREVRPGRRAQETAQILLERVAEFANDEFDDDMTVVLIARNTGKSKH